MSEVKVNKISPRTNCGTVQLGDSGDTITIPSGATISNSGTASGFGSTGEVSWNTTKITADPGNAVSGVGYFTDTSGGAFSVTLPSSPSAGNVVAVADYANTWDTNNLTIARNGSNIEGAASDFVCNIEGSTITFVYVDATKGWVVTNSGNSTQAFEIKYVAATGGNTVTTCGNFKIHKFTGPGTFTVTCGGNSGGSNTVSYFVLGGGGGGGRDRGGGGGAGGVRESKAATDCYSASPLNATSGPTYNLPVTAQAYPITVGAGGSGGPNGSTPPAADNDGNNSVFSTITAAKGGGGANGNSPDGGQNGGSGGGGAGSGVQTAGTGNTPPVSPPQGQNGGTGGDGTPTSGGGGGGAGNAGQPRQDPGGAGDGGIGISTSVTGSAVKYAGGGGGGNRPGCGGSEGSGGTFPGVPAPSPQADRFGAGNGGNPTQCATANSGSGGGAANPGANGANGGSGIVVIRYKFQ
jgi:hypothetical protein